MVNGANFKLVILTTEALHDSDHLTYPAPACDDSGSDRNRLHPVLDSLAGLAYVAGVLLLIFIPAAGIVLGRACREPA
jgi:hypothetical protein